MAEPVANERNKPQRSRFRAVHAAVSNLLIPPSCLNCSAPLPADETIQVCQQCQRKIPNQDLLPHQCHRCSARLKVEVIEDGGCRFCKDLDSFPFASVTSLGNYQGQLRELVILMKSRQGQTMSLQLGTWLAEATCLELKARKPSLQINYIIPMPSHWLRKLGRGHNVPSLLAESFSRLAPYRNRVHRCLKVTRRTRKQGTLTMNQRFENVKGSISFNSRKPLRVNNNSPNRDERPSVLLIDDVMTSGATAIQAGKVLQNAGAGQVHLAVVARAVGRIL